MCPQISLKTCDPAVISHHFWKLKRDPSLGHFRDEPVLFDESIPSLLELPTTVVATQNMTEDRPPVTVTFHYSITPAHVPFGLEGALAPLHPPAVAAAPTFEAPDTADVGVSVPQVPERSQLLTQDFRTSDSSDNLLPQDSSPYLSVVPETPSGIDAVDRSLPAEAVPTDRQPSRHLLRQNLHPTNFSENCFKRQGTAPQTISTE